MDRERVLPHQTVLIEDGRIATLGPTAKVRVPAGAVRIQSQGRFLIPGLADMHAHLRRWHDIGVEDLLSLWVANGVTTIRNMDFYDRDSTVLHWRAMAAAGQAVSPRIYTAGAWTPRGSDNAPSRIAEDVADYKAAGYDFIKIHNNIDQESLDSVLAAAKRIGLPVVGHVPLSTRVEHVIPRGYTCIEHSFLEYLWNNRTLPPNGVRALSGNRMRDTAGVRALISGVRRAGIWHCPTQTLYDRLASSPDMWQRLSKVDGRLEKDGFKPLPNVLKIELDSGINLLTGSDQVPWRGVITRELQALVQAGLTPYQALRTATYNPAAYFGTLAETGTIAPGKRADLVLLTGNPLRDVRYTAQPLGVMLGGRWLSRDQLDRRVARLGPGHPPQAGVASHGSGGATGQMSFTSYWANVLDEFAAPVAGLAEDVVFHNSASGGNPVMGLVRMLDSAQRVRVLRLVVAYDARRSALLDSVGKSDDYAASIQRVVALIAPQLAEMRATLPPAQRATFEPQVPAWLAGRTADDSQAVQRVWLRRLLTAHDARRRAFLDSLGESDDYEPSTRRVAALIARELGEIRAILTPAQRATFDPQAAAWLAARRAEGYVLTVPSGRP